MRRSAAAISSPYNRSMNTSRRPATREWLRVLTYEVADMRGIAGEGALVQLAAVPGMHEELDSAPQGRDRAREAAGAAPQARGIVAQLGIVGLDAIGLTLARRDGVGAWIVDKRLIGGEGVGVVLLRRDRTLKGLLQGVPGALPDHVVAHDAAGGAIHFRHDIAGAFL